MLTPRRQPLANRISWAAAICLALGGLFVTSCEHPPASNSTASSPTPRTEAIAAGVVLRADPNPVPGGTVAGKTTIRWKTGSDAVGDVYVGPAGSERLFASGPKGSQDAPWIQPGSTEFRLYNHADHKLLEQLTVTMPSVDASVSRPTETPISSPSP
jgi:hypothetical protein